ncbi:MAG: radical SAM protein [Clostridia bacterium]|nr:radical SAM protein [Clostridia bacterium]
MKCNICPRKCNVDRSINAGFCNANNSLKIAKYMVHYWEEPIISGTNGSGAIFFSHCNLKCVYCQNYQISSLGEGKHISTHKLIDIIKQLENKGVHNINLVTPSHYTNQIIEALTIYKSKVPIVWNSNGYESVNTIKRLKDLVDIYLVDMKYMDENLALNLSGAKDYPQICQQAILEMRKNQPQDIVIDGMMQKGVIVRHLVLPSEIQNSFNVLDWVNNALGKDTYISVMGQYIPYHLVTTQPQYAKYNRSLKPIEYKRVINHLNTLGFINGFYQDLSSASECFIPDFNKFSN